MRGDGLKETGEHPPGPALRRGSCTVLHATGADMPPLTMPPCELKGECYCNVAPLRPVESVEPLARLAPDHDGSDDHGHPRMSAQTSSSGSGV